jgi:3-deoxy-D-manno-octulosonic-acid transferase
MQSSEDADRITQIGAPPERVKTTGNLKFDQRIPTEQEPPLSIPPGRQVITAGSTHRGEEAILLDVFSRLRAKHPGIVLIIAPRHPERFDEVCSIITGRGYACQRRTRMVEPVQDVVLLDTIGELRSFYGLADIAFVGGSFVKVGGHNLLEPAAMKKPVLFSSYMFNFKEISEEITLAGGGFLVKDKEELYQKLDMLLSNRDLSVEMGKKAFSVIEANSGAAVKTLRLVEGLLGAE